MINQIVDGFNPSALINSQSKDADRPWAGGITFGAPSEVFGRLLHVGGNWSNGSNAGVGYANGNNSLSNSNINIGARLANISYYSDCRLASWPNKTNNNPTRSLGERRASECRSIPW